MNRQTLSDRLSQMRYTFTFITCLFLLATTAISAQDKVNTTPSGLKYVDQKVGTGDEAVKGTTVEVHYTGWLYVDGKRGKKFDSSLDRGQPFRFGLGAKQVIAGWDEGVQGMKVGGKRKLVVPPDLGYGKQGYPPLIPKNATLVFDIELLGVG